VQLDRPFVRRLRQRPPLALLRPLRSVSLRCHSRPRPAYLRSRLCLESLRSVRRRCRCSRSERQRSRRLGRLGWASLHCLARPRMRRRRRRQRLQYWSRRAARSDRARVRWLCSPRPGKTVLRSVRRDEAWRTVPRIAEPLHVKVIAPRAVVYIESQRRLRRRRNVRVRGRAGTCARRTCGEQGFCISISCSRSRLRRAEGRKRLAEAGLIRVVQPRAQLRGLASARLLLRRAVTQPSIPQEEL
jgi:hypothetical protein